MLFKFFLQVLGQLRVLTVIHRTVNDAWLILLKGILQNGNQILCLFHTIPLGMHAFRILHKIGIREIHITWLSKTIDLLPFNEAISESQSGFPPGVPFHIPDCSS